MKTILFYGDSLVYGKIPKKPERYERSKRFIGIIEQSLGSEVKVLDEGLRARTLSGENVFFPERDGLNQFGPILGSHLPLDIVCIFLGTNDCNRGDQKTESDIEISLQEYKNKIKFWTTHLNIPNEPKIIIIAPPIISTKGLQNDELMEKIFGPEAEEKSKSLSRFYKSFCEKENCLFFDASLYCGPDTNEGVHLTEDSNNKLGLALAEFIKKLLK